MKLNAPREYDALNPQYLSLGTGLQSLQPNRFYGTVPTAALSQPTVARRQLLLPYPRYTGISLVNASWGNSIYHAMMLKAEKRFSGGVNFLLSYTVGKLISDVLGSLSTYDNPANAGLGTSVQNWYNLRGERSVSELDIPQTVALSYVAELPFGAGKPFLRNVTGIPGRFIGGWKLTGVMSRRSGFPLVLSAPITGGGNRPNTPHLYEPVADIGSVQFGQINSTTGNPRVMQLALKVLF